MHKPRGAFEYQVINEDGSIEQQSDGEIKNLILDSFLGHHKNNNNANNYRLVIGSGVQTNPQKTDTSLGNQVASTGGFAIDGSPYGAGYEYKDGFVRIFTITKDFSGLNQNITEIGISKEGILLTKALIRDQNQNPVTIPLTSTQTLRITYRIYWYFPAVVSEGVFQTDIGDIEYKVCLQEHIEPAIKFLNSVQVFSLYPMFAETQIYTSIFNGAGFDNKYATFSENSNKIKIGTTINHASEERDFGYSNINGYRQVHSTPKYSLYFKNGVKIPANTKIVYEIEYEFGWIDDGEE